MSSSSSSPQSQRLHDNMEVIVSFPDLLSQEETIANTPHDVTAWCLYLSHVDALLESIDEQLHSNKKKKAQQLLLGRTSIDTSSDTNNLSNIRRQLVRVRCFVAERAVTLLPGSYKLWRNHLLFCTGKTHHGSPSREPHSSSLLSETKFYQHVTRAYEQCLIRLHKCPRIWLEYLSWVEQHCVDVTTIRQLYDRALLALPVSQHDKIWPPYLKFVTQTKETQEEEQEPPTTSTTKPSLVLEIPMETTLRVMRRYVTYDHSAKEQLAKICVKGERWGEAALTYMDLLNDHSLLLQTSRHDLWLQLAEICTHHPQQVFRAGIDFDAIVRAVLPKQQSSSSTSKKNREEEASWTAYDKLQEEEEDGSQQQQQQQLQQQLGEMEGTLWTKLADYHIRAGEFELARSIYEEALESVSKVRDFSIIFDAYVKFEEGVIEAMMALQQEDDEQGEEEDGANTTSSKDQEEDDEDWDILMGESMMEDGGEGLSSSNSSNTMADIELALARAEHLTSRRPLLLNRVLLRQNPHNVGEWLRRSELYVSRQMPEMAASSLEESLEKVHARRAVNGTPSQLVTTLSKVYEEELHNIDKARNVYERICNQQGYQFRDVDDLAQCYAAWVELELRQEKWDDALAIARRAVASPDATNKNKAARGLYKSLVLWDLLLDLEESLGTVQTTKDSYNRALELRVASPMHVMNYANFLKDQKYFEEAFTAYERGVELFAFPQPGAKLLWKNYLTFFMERYKGTKIERARDLFERCLESCPPEVCSEFFMLNGQYEEEHGLTKRALGVYRAMCAKVPPEEKYTAYQLYIAKTIKYLGIPATRDIYQEAIAALADTPAAQMCLDFAKMETSLSELERARTVLAYGAQLADPRRNPEYWKTWHEFEVSHGNEDTFREMLRVKRSVQAAFSTVNYNAAEMGAGTEVEDTLTNEQALSMIADREGVSVKDKPRIGGFVQGKRTAELAELDEVENRVAKLRKATADVTGGGGEENVAAAADAGGSGDDEIDIDDDDDDDEGPQESAAAGPTPSVHDVSTKAVPAAVFGGLAPSGKTDSSEEGGSTPKLGALERLRAAAAASSDAQQ